MKLFFHQDFHLYGDKQQDTAFYEPLSKSVIHYRKKRYFLIGGMFDQVGIDSYSIGKSEYNGLEGTWRDAEDGKLEKNPIDQGSVDSTIEFNLHTKANSERTLYFWICAGKNLDEVQAIQKYLLKEKPEKLMRNTINYWLSWVNKNPSSEYGITSPKIQEHFKQSLLIMRTQIDNRGAIIAANDSDIMKFNKDTYTYMWPRDGAWVALAFDRAGYSSISQRFFRFCAKVMSSEGYLLPKYNPDLSVGSSWHPWYRDDKIQIPIQEDETALVLYALKEHYQKFHDIEFIQEMYESIIRAAGNFLTNFVDEITGLPLPTYDLWERERGIFAYTVATVYAGIKSAGNLCKILGHFNHHKRYAVAAEEIKKSILDYLYDPESGRFLKAVTLNKNTGEISKDYTVDASLHALWMLGVLPSDDSKIVRTNEAVLSKLSIPTEIGGIARYENDDYMRVQ